MSETRSTRVLWTLDTLSAVALVGVLALAAGGARGQSPAKEPSGPAPGGASRPAEGDEDATELIVHLKDGRRFVGPVVRQNATEVVINIAGIAQPFATEDIERLETLAPLMQRYQELKEAVGNNPDQIVGLAEWLQQRGKYELALTEVLHALSIDKVNGPALKLRALLEQQIILKARRVQKDPSRPEEHPAPPRPSPGRPADFPMLSKEDVELIKVYETRPEENPRVLISAQTTRKMLEKYADNPLVPLTREGREAILRQSPLEILGLMYKLQARDFYGQVEVLDQPRSFVVFRDHVCGTWLVNSCSTTLCHGGMEAGRFVLQSRRPNQERTVYTNFYILSKFRLADGAALIDWEEPEKSPLLQLGLPRDKSRRPHPEVPRGLASRDTFKPVFRTTDDAQFKQAVEWIKSLYRPRPEYPIVYAPLMPLSPPPKPKPGETPPVPPAPAKPEEGRNGSKGPTDSPGGSAPEPKQEPQPR
jgi:hypothetical protein